MKDTKNTTTFRPKEMTLRLKQTLCRLKEQSILILAMATILVLIFSISVEHASASEKEVHRISGIDRFETAVKISQEGWPHTTPTVFLVRHDNFADALAGAPLAYSWDAPILLTEPDNIPQTTLNEIERLNAYHVVILGGPGAISDSVESELISRGRQVDRIGGNDRYETAKFIAEELHTRQTLTNPSYSPHNQTAVLVSGRNFPDALAIAPFAARNGWPILLTEADYLPEASREALVQIGSTSTVITGGLNAISQSVEDAVRPYTGAISRIAGSDRYQTASAIVSKLDNSSKRAYLATGASFADALTGSVLAAKNNAPILLVQKDQVNLFTHTVINERQYNSLFVLGGTSVISIDVINELVALKPPGIVRIFIDPGHGGKDPGAVGNGIRESDVALDISRHIRDVLLSEYEDVEVMMSRDADIKICTGDDNRCLSERSAMANAWQANYFVSVHSNAHTNKAAKGFESFIWNGNVSADSEQKQQIIHDHIVREMGMIDRGKKSANFAVLRQTTMPAILFEYLFISNEEDAAKLRDPAYRKKLGRVTAEGIAQAWGLSRK